MARMLEKHDSEGRLAFIKPRIRGLDGPPFAGPVEFTSEGDVSRGFTG